MSSTTMTPAVARYEPVRQTLPGVLPPITRHEAQAAVRALYRKFGKLDSGRQLKPYPVRRCWISPKPTAGHHKGWGRLVHDVSHLIFRATYPRKRPHDVLHARYETDVAAYVAASGWLHGSLRQAPKAAPTRDQKMAAELVKVEARLKSWRTKAKRAATAIKKLERSKKSLLKNLAANTEATA